MTLTLILEHPDRGMVAAQAVTGSLDCQLERYPRWSVRADIRPDLASGVPLEDTPYGTRAHVIAADGSIMFTGHVHEARGRRPDGAWTITAADPILLFSQWKFSDMPGQRIPGAVLSMAGFIQALAAHIGISVQVAGDGGAVDPRTIDPAGKNGWRIVEDQLIANNLDVWPQPDGTLLVGPTAAVKAVPDKVLQVGQTGTITMWDVTMRRQVNRVVIAHRAQKDGEDDRWIEGVWEDRDPPSGIDQTGPVVHEQTVPVGADWWDDLPGHQAQADANAAAVGQVLRGLAREAVVEAIPDYTLRPGMTVDVKFTDAAADRFLVSAVRWPLEPGPMTVQARNPEPGRRQGAAFLRRDTMEV